jgi:hypothetical protein
MEFIDPPPEAKGQRSERWREIVSTLKDKKGEWARVGNFSPGVATHIRRGQYKAFLGGWEGSEGDVEAYMKRHWQVTTRKTDDGKRNDVYVRWLG